LLDARTVTTGNINTNTAHRRRQQTSTTYANFASVAADLAVVLVCHPDVPEEIDDPRPSSIARTQPA
jgi:hypothetical protein